MAMFKIFLISCVGILCATYPKNDPILGKDALRHFSRLNTFVLSPALIVFALGSALNAQLFIHLSLLIPFAILIISLSYLFGFLLKFIHEENDMLYKSSLVSVASPNAFALPILVMSSLCADSNINEDYDNDSEACFEESSSMIFIYIIPWLLQFWSYGYSTLASINTSEFEDDQSKTELTSFRSGFGKTSRKLLLVLQNPALIGVYVGLTIGLIPGLGSYMFDSVTVLQPFGGAVEILAAPVVALNSLIMAASLAHIDVDWSELLPCIWNKGLAYENRNSSHGDDSMSVEIEVEMEIMDISDIGITRSGMGKPPRSRTSSSEHSACVLSDPGREDRKDLDFSPYDGFVAHNGFNTESDGFAETRSQRTVSTAERSCENLKSIYVAEVPKCRSIFYIALCRFIIYFCSLAIICNNFCKSIALI